MNPAEVAAPPSAGRSPSLTAILSFLWPGLGHWYTHRPRAALLFAAFWLGMGGLWVLQGALSQVAGKGHVWNWQLLTVDLWNALTWALLTPLVLALARRFTGHTAAAAA